MCLLDKHQVDIIVADVQLAGITFSHLPDDLVDHICCEIENLMGKGDNFKQAYEKVKMQAGISALKKVEENTKLLIDKKYRLMKTTMKVTGIISLILLGLATVFKIMHWPGSGIGFVTGFTTLFMVFFPLAVFTNFVYANKKQNLFLHIAALLGGMIFMIGVMYKIMHWPGSGIMIMIGYLFILLLFLPTLLIVHIKKAKSRKDKLIYILGALSIIIYGFSNMFKMFHWPGASVLMLFGAFLLISVFLPLFTWRRIQLEGKITGQFVYIITIFMFLILFTSLIALNVSSNVMNGFTNQANNQEILNDYLIKKNLDLYTEIENMTDTLDIKANAVKIKKTADELCHYIDNIQIKLLTVIDNIDEESLAELLKNPENIKYKDNTDVVFLYMIGERGTGEAIVLKQKLTEFKYMMIEKFSNDKKFIEQLNSFFNFSVNYNHGEPEPWDIYNFYDSSLIQGISKLKELQTSIRYSESIALDKLIIRNTNL
ncbi:MAG: hypothetical protein HY951_10190 [Bacteroidia bacterium]|nr:hypothetical protein [Bacteroidia bacterium]